MKLALLIFILIGCAQNNKSVVQTLDNLTRAPDKDIQWNQCSGTNTTGEADYKIDITGVSAADGAAAITEVKKALSAVPDRKLKKNFFKIGKIKILNPADVEKKCAAGLSDATLQSITEQGQQSGPRFCWQLEDNSTITANLSSDPQDIHHHTVKMFGYLVTQIYVKYAENFPPSERLYWLAEKFKEGRRLVFLGFIEDLETKKTKSRLNDVEKKYYNDFKTALKTSTCSDLEDLENLIFAESFDSYYCTPKTKSSMKTNFSYVYTVFDRQQQGITEEKSTNFSVNLIQSKYKPVLKSCILSKQQEAAQAKAIELSKQAAANADKVMTNNKSALPTSRLSTNPVAQTYTQTTAQVAATNAAAQAAAQRAATTQQQAAANNNPLASIQGVLSNPLVTNILKTTGLDKQLSSITGLLSGNPSAIASALPGLLSISNPASAASNLPFTPFNPTAATPPFIAPGSIDPSKIGNLNVPSSLSSLNTGITNPISINPNTLTPPTLSPDAPVSFYQVDPTTNPIPINSDAPVSFYQVDPSTNPIPVDTNQFEAVTQSLEDIAPNPVNDISLPVDDISLPVDDISLPVDDISLPVDDAFSPEASPLPPASNPFSEDISDVG